MICIVKRILNGKELKTRKVIKKGHSDTIEVSEEAENVILIIRVAKNSENKRVFRRKFKSFKNLSFSISGDFNNPKVNQD